ncbi:hypothetical protein WH47_08826 [Habropoda laboriosa]|uniref:Uncharacterized protein n=1 Tax=Habropoda laboriosa TaxID=597456 RepID=A0A0L7R6F7_9HYME|nr:hypothetical protein WH47_08826 [Habropoda laboriosa]
MKMSEPSYSLPVPDTLHPRRRPPQQPPPSRLHPVLRRKTLTYPDLRGPKHTRTPNVSGCILQSAYLEQS